jgi:hypothetical protein
LAGPFHYVIVGRILPQYEVLDDPEESLSFNCGLFFVFAVPKTTALLIAGIIDKLSKDDRACRRQGTPRPPQMQCTWVSVADGFLFRTRYIDRVQG